MVCYQQNREHFLFKYYSQLPSFWRDSHILKLINDQQLLSNVTGVRDGNVFLRQIERRSHEFNLS